MVGYDSNGGDDDDLQYWILNCQYQIYLDCIYGTADVRSVEQPVLSVLVAIVCLKLDLRFFGWVFLILGGQNELF